MSLDIDRLLTEDAETWRASLPRDDGPQAAFDARSPGTRRHRGLAVAASVAAVLVAAGVVLGIRWNSSTNTPSTGAHSFSGPCQNDFVAGSSTYKPAPQNGFQNLQVTLSYRGLGACRVSAYGPFMELRDAKGNLLGVGAHTTLEAVQPDYLVVRPGDSLALAMRWTPRCPASAPVTRLILHLDGQPDRSGVGVAVSVTSDYAPTCPSSHVAHPLSGFVERPHLIVGITAAQKALALHIAHEEANGSIPGGPTDTRGLWPANVDSVSAIATTASAGARYVGGSTSATGKVLVIRLTGRFSLVTSGPPGSGNATGNELTVLVPLNVRRVSEVGLDKRHPPAMLPDSTTLFAR